MFAMNRTEFCLLVIKLELFLLGRKKLKRYGRSTGGKTKFRFDCR